MADKDQYNDEYQFADLDAIGPESGDDGETGGSTSSMPDGEQRADANTNNIKRNALIVVAIVILAMVGYKFMGSFHFETKLPEKTIPSPVTVAPPIPVQAPPSAPAPAPSPEVLAPNVDAKINQKLSVLELSQQSMRSDVSSVSDQLGGISSNVNAMIAKMTELNGVIASLSSKVEEQSRALEQLTIHQEAKKHHYVAHKSVHYPKYYLQAVIPGRAWLIATNGATLTVREGTVIAGYGMVKLIDPNQGRVSTSSGQVIRFSQEDS